MLGSWIRTKVRDRVGLSAAGDVDEALEVAGRGDDGRDAQLELLAAAGFDVDVGVATSRTFGLPTT